MKPKSILTGAAAIVLAGAVLIPPVPAFAQSVQKNAPEEIIVTARKRQESILAVPVVTYVLTAVQMDRHLVKDVRDITSITPGVLVGENFADTGTQVSIRGVGTSQFDPGIDQSISLNIDGLQLTHGTAYRSATFDMAQVEVLKGPQALFYGKSSPGGVISIHTADPGDKLEAMGRVGYEVEARQATVETVFSSPITQSFGIRLAAQYSSQDGYFKNDAVGLASTGAVPGKARFNNGNSITLRGTALYKVEKFSAKLKVNYIRDRYDDGQPLQLTSCPDGLVNYTGIPFYAPNEDCTLNRTLHIVRYTADSMPGVTHDGKDFTHTTQKYGTLELNYNVTPEVTLTSLTGYYGSVLTGLFTGGATGYAAPTITAQKDFHRRDFTQEVRANSEFKGPLNFTLGGFYQNSQVKDFISTFGNRLYGLPQYVSHRNHDMHIKTYSLFGQLRYAITPEIELAGGVRWTDEGRNDNIITILGGDLTGYTLQYPQVPKLRSKNWSPEFTLTYRPSQDLTIFGSFKQGYKSGSYTFTQVSPGGNNSFGDEKVQGGEIGAKARLANRQIYANIAGYYYVYKGLQVGAGTQPQNLVPLFVTLNAGSAKVYGVDFDMAYRPDSVPGLDLHTAINWNHARFTRFDNAPCWGGQTIAEGCNRLLNPVNGRFTAQDLGGTPLIRAPAWQITAGANYEMSVWNNKTLDFGGDIQYSSRFLTVFGRRADYYQHAYAKLNANISLKGENDAWEVSVVGHNLNDKLTSGFCSPTNFAGGAVLPGSISGTTAPGPSGKDELLCVPERGRELWFRVTLRPSSL